MDAAGNYAAQGLVPNAQPPERQTECGVLDERAEQILHRLTKLGSDMARLADRAFGPVPEEVGRTAEPQAEPPMLRKLAMRLDGIEIAIVHAERQMERLNQIA